jgi:hypothetical protein
MCPGTTRVPTCEGKECANAFTSNIDSSERNSCSVLAGRSIHTHTGNDQAAFQCCRVESENEEIQADESVVCVVEGT